MAKSKFSTPSPYPTTKFRQEGKGASTPTSCTVARPRTKTPTGNKPDASVVMGKTGVVSTK